MDSLTYGELLLILTHTNDIDLNEVIQVKLPNSSELLTVRLIEDEKGIVLEVEE